MAELPEATLRVRYGGSGPSSLTLDPLHETFLMAGGVNRCNGSYWEIFLKSRFFQIARILTAENTFLRAATRGPTSESSVQCTDINLKRVLFYFGNHGRLFQQNRPTSGCHHPQLRVGRY